MCSGRLAIPNVLIIFLLLGYCLLTKAVAYAAITLCKYVWLSIWVIKIASWSTYFNVNLSLFDLCLSLHLWIYAKNSKNWWNLFYPLGNYLVSKSLYGWVIIVSLWKRNEVFWIRSSCESLCNISKLITVNSRRVGFVLWLLRFYIKQAEMKLQHITYH